MDQSAPFVEDAWYNQMWRKRFDLQIFLGYSISNIADLGDVAFVPLGKVYNG